MISVLCPSRGRPGWLDRMWQSALDTAAGRVELVVYLDEDDPSDYQVDGTVVRGPRVVLSDTWNRCYEQASGDVVMHAADDIVFRTVGWDRKVLDEFGRWPDRIVFVHGRDGIQDEKLGTHGFLHRRWVDTVGYVCPPYFSSDFNDTWLTEVADRIGRRRYLPDLLIEHLHWTVGKAPVDRTHKERLIRGRRDGVEATYAAKAGERERDAQLLREAT